MHRVGCRRRLLLCGHVLLARGVDGVMEGVIDVTLTLNYLVSLVTLW